jgi:hypothetical protein
MLDPNEFPVDAVALAAELVAAEPALDPVALLAAAAMLDELDAYSREWDAGRKADALALADYARAWDADATAQGNPAAFWR